jgi:hypothetical protein
LFRSEASEALSRAIRELPEAPSHSNKDDIVSHEPNAAIRTIRDEIVDQRRAARKVHAGVSSSPVRVV